MVMPRVDQRLLLRQISNIHDWILGNAKKEVDPYHTCDLLLGAVVKYLINQLIEFALQVIGKPASRQS